MKGITRAQWINLSEQQIRIVDTNYILCRKIGPVHLAEPGVTAGRQVVGRWQTKYK